MSEKSFNKTIIVSAVSLNYFEQCQKHQKRLTPLLQCMQQVPKKAYYSLKNCKKSTLGAKIQSTIGVIAKQFAEMSSKNHGKLGFQKFARKGLKRPKMVKITYEQWSRNVLLTYFFKGHTKLDPVNGRNFI